MPNNARAALLAAVEKMRWNNVCQGQKPDFPTLLDAALLEARAPLEATITELRDEIEQHLLLIGEHQRIVEEAREEQKREELEPSNAECPNCHHGIAATWGFCPFCSETLDLNAVPPPELREPNPLMTYAQALQRVRRLRDQRKWTSNKLIASLLMKVQEETAAILRGTPEQMQTACPKCGKPITTAHADGITWTCCHCGWRGERGQCSGPLPEGRDAVVVKEPGKTKFVRMRGEEANDQK